MATKNTTFRSSIFATSAFAAIAPALAATICMATVAQAQEAAPAASAEAAPGDITVTARRKSERLLDVPLNVTALTGEAMKDLGVASYRDLMNVVPSLNTQANDRGDSVKLTMRGLGVSTTGTAKASVFLDGVYIGGNYTGIPVAGLSTIEVLKGPQSALFGRSTFAGAMNYVTRKPTDTFEGSIDVELATLGEKKVDGFVSGPIVPGRLYAFVSGSYMDYNGPDGWKTPGTGSRNGAQSGYGGMAKLVYTPTDTLTVTALASYARIDDEPTAALFIDPASRDGAIAKINPATGVATGQVVYYPTRIRSISSKNADFDVTNEYLDNPGYRAKTLTTYLKAEWHSDSGYAVTLTGGYGEQHATSELNVNLRDRAPTAGYGYLYSMKTVLKETDKSVELRVSTPDDKPIRLAAGGYYLDLRKTYDPEESASYLLAPVVGTYDLIIPHYYADTRTQDRSVFGAAYVDIVPSLTLSLEGRYQSEKIRTVSADSVTVLASRYDPAAPYTLTNQTFNATFDAFLPRASLQYRISDRINVYATYSEGTTPGGFNTSIYTLPEYRTIKEENLRNYEIGFKGRITPTLTIEAAAYHMDWLNQQTTGTFYVSGVNVALTTNQGNSKINGLEALVNWTTPVEGLNLRLAASYNDAEYKDFCSANYAALTYDVRSLTAAQKTQYACRDVSGSKLESISPWQGTVSFDYSRAITERLKGFLRGDYDYFGPMWDSEFNLAKTEAAQVVNVRAGLESGPWTLEVYGKNITNEDAPVRVQRASDVYAGYDNTTNQSITMVLRRPRQFGLRMGYRF
ncbi:TonB-dependent receptor [Novosphingobium sp. BL-52-GroH]|uniref:TonB-dependent receptor n=1 Tax=Novosphingobium sp. BL-52-GroH TaxID=3349877 RepID=UPI00384FF8D9